MKRHTLPATPRTCAHADVHVHTSTHAHKFTHGLCRFHAVQFTLHTYFLTALLYGNVRGIIKKSAIQIE